MVVVENSDDSFGESKRSVFLRILKKFESQTILRRITPLRVLIYAGLFLELGNGSKNSLTIVVHNRPRLAGALCLFRAFINSRLKVVLHMHNSHLINESYPTFNFLVRYCDLIVFCSEFLMRECLEKSRYVGSDRMLVVYNAADNSVFYPRKNIKNNIVFVGRMVEEKGVHLAVEAFVKYKGIFGDSKLTVVGSQNFRELKNDKYYKGLLSMSDYSVEFVGNLSKESTANIIGNSSILICSSIWQEPFGMVVCEAMASGCLVIASNVGGIPEQIDDSCGILIEPSVENIYNALIYARSLDERVVDEITAQALLRQRTFFSWNVISQKYDKALMDLHHEH